MERKPAFKSRKSRGLRHGSAGEGAATKNPRDTQRKEKINSH